MRLPGILLCGCAWLSLCVLNVDGSGNTLARRHGSSASVPNAQSTNLPSLPSGTAAAASASASSRPTSQSEESFESSPTTAFATSESSTAFTTSKYTSPLSVEIQPAPTASSQPSRNSTTSANADMLPLKPEITPALSVGGVILMLTGLVLTLIGIKNRWIQIFLSTAYLTSIAVTVLIVYVMDPTISDAIQGAYLVAIFMSGLIFGAGALIFKEVTEGLGCLLGGFCLSMWLLTLRPGGSLQSTIGKAILIGVFCVVCWGLSFIQYTRGPALIASTSFAGATALVLGIDCFSRGGYGDFWLYIWNLNSNLFPLNTNTYPLTRGIRVEIAAIVLFCLIGIISQIRLWKTIRDRRKVKEAAQLEEEQRRDTVDEALGRHLERQNTKAKAQWEALYGGKGPNKSGTVVSSSTASEDGAVPTTVNEKRSSSRMSLRYESQAGTEMKDILAPSRVSWISTRRQSTQPLRPISRFDEHHRAMSAVDEEKEIETRSQHQNPATESRETVALEPTPGSAEDEIVENLTQPSVIPLPFTIPTSVHSRDSIEDVSTELPTEPPTETRQEVPMKSSKRLSIQNAIKRISGFPGDTHFISHSEEALVVPHFNHSRASSLAATLDCEHDVLHLSSFTPRASMLPVESEPSGLKAVVPEPDQSPILKSPPIEYTPAADVPPSPPALSIVFDDPEEFARPLSPKQTEDLDGVDSRLQSHVDKVQSEEDVHERSRASSARHASEAQEPFPRVEPTTETLTTGALQQVPSQMSHVVMSYRTNEWAKHISTAEEPKFDERLPTDEDLEDEAPVRLVDHSAFITARAETPLKRQSALTAAKKASYTSTSDSERSLSPIKHVSTDPTYTNGRGTPNITLSKPLRSSASAGDLLQQPSSPSVPSNNVHGLRSASTPYLVQQSLVRSPIDENAEAHFAAMPRPPVNSLVPMHPRTMARIPSPSVWQSQSPAGFDKALYQEAQHSNSRLSLANEGGPRIQDSRMSQTPSPMLWRAQSSGALDQVMYQDAMRSDSRLSYATEGSSNNLHAHHSGAAGGPRRSETRMSSYDSHQPLRQSVAPDAAKRASMLAEWRGAMHNRVTDSAVPHHHIEISRASMMMGKNETRRAEEQRKAFQQRKDMAMDQAMRSVDMQTLHREAMRKMQAAANRHV